MSTSCLMRRSSRMRDCSRLEQTTDSINAELVAVDDELETINDELESKFSNFNITFHVLKHFLTLLSYSRHVQNMLFAFY